MESSSDDATEWTQGYNQGVADAASRDASLQLYRNLLDQGFENYRLLATKAHTLHKDLERLRGTVKSVTLAVRSTMLLSKDLRKAFARFSKNMGDSMSYWERSDLED